jgi:SAM-dependent methyltransferase
VRVVGSCPICGGQQFEELGTREVSHPGDDLYGNLLDINYVRNYILFERVLRRRGTMEFTFLVCTYCGLIFFNPRPEEKDMAVKYAMMDQLRDTELREAQQGNPIYDDKRAWDIYTSLGRFRELNGLRVVDVGGATGYNLKCFVRSNSCFVVDYCKRDLVEGVSYLCRMASDIPDTMTFDLVLCCHTLEHMVDPVSEVTKMRRAMSPGGLLYIEVPMGCHSEYKHTRNCLTHINFFSEGSVRHLFTACNMKLKYIRTKLTTVRWFRWLSIVAIAENSPPERPVRNGYEITVRQMNNPFYHCVRHVGYGLSRLERYLQRVGSHCQR